MSRAYPLYSIIAPSLGKLASGMLSTRELPAACSDFVQAFHGYNGQACINFYIIISWGVVITQYFTCLLLIISGLDGSNLFLCFFVCSNAK